eukprot:scaffold24367_cov127-Cylindrotheca_fusiformis.AAC.1
MRIEYLLILLVTAAAGKSTQVNNYGAKARPRHCKGGAKHIHLAVGHDPACEITISFATKWSEPSVTPPVAGVHIGLKPNQLDRFFPEQGFPSAYESMLSHGRAYHAPYQHHIEVTGLEPDTTYYYVAVAGDREDGVETLKVRPLRDHPTQHVERFEDEDEDVEDDPHKRRRLNPPYYDGSDKPCIESHRVRSFKTAPASSDNPVSFAIIGDLGQFEHSQETLDHMRDHKH